MINVICVDDHPLIREAIRSLTEVENDIQLVGEGGSADDIARLINKHKPNVAILDLNIPSGPTFQILSEIRRITSDTETNVIVLSQQDSKSIIAGVMSRGARGYLVKTDNLSMAVAPAIRTVATGGLYLSETATHQYLGASTTIGFDLTARHIEILQCVARYPNHSYEYHAELLNISEGTLRNHIARLFKLLDVNNMTAAILRAIEIGLIDMDFLRQR